MQDIDLCAELERVMRTTGFKESSVSNFLNSQQYKNATGQPAAMQRVMLTMYFYNLVMYSGTVPDQIRIALAAAFDPLAWFEDISNTVLPFVLVNEDTFFKTLQ